MDELSQSQVDELHADLLQLQVELKQTVESSRELTGTVHLDQSAVGRISRIDAIQSQKMAEAAQRRTVLRLQQVAVAMRSFAEGEYGECKRCGESIGYGRLKARPETVACVPCMRELEQEHG